jgi:hypothetical protein
MNAGLSPADYRAGTRDQTEILIEASNALLGLEEEHGASRDLRIDINPKTGEIRARQSGGRRKIENPQDEIL